MEVREEGVGKDGDNPLRNRMNRTVWYLCYLNLVANFCFANLSDSGILHFLNARKESNTCKISRGKVPFDSNSV